MSIPSGIPGNQDSVQLPINPQELAGIQEDIDRINETEALNTSLESHLDANQRLDKSDYALRTVLILENTYCFKKEDAEKISAFAEAIHRADTNVLVDVKPGFLTKIKLLCVKMLAFFSNQDKSVQLRREGLAVFKNLKSMLLAPNDNNRLFTLKFIDDNKGNQKVLKGFSRILGLSESEAQPEQLKAFINVNYFNKLKNYDEKTEFLSEVLVSVLKSENKEKELDALRVEFGKLRTALSNDLNSALMYKIREIIVTVKDQSEQGVRETFDSLAPYARLYYGITQAVDNPMISSASELEDLVKYAEKEGLYSLLLDPQLLKISPEAKEFLEQTVLPLTKEEVQAGLAKELCKPSKSMTTVFSSQNQIFQDLARDFTLKIQGIDIKLPKTDLPKGINSRQEWAFRKLQEAIKALPQSEQERVQEFCKNFSTQGILAIENHPRLQQQARIEGETTHLDVRFSKGSIHVCVTAGGKAGVNAIYGDPDAFITTNITTPVCKFEFDYNPNDGSSSNVNVVEYSGQTVKIVSGYSGAQKITF